MKLRRAVLLLLGMLPWAGLYADETATTAFRVTASVVEFCDVTAPDLASDNYTAQSGAPLLRATCTPNTTYSVGVTKGVSPGEAASQRKTESGAQASNYQLVTGVGTGEPVDHALFGGVPAGQVILPVDSGESLSLRVYY